MTPRDVALEGLERGISLPGLRIVQIRGKGLGIVTSSRITKGTFVTEYKYGKRYYSRKEMKKAESDYIVNKEGCYMLEVFVGGNKQYLDATRRFRTYGRWANGIVVSCSSDFCFSFSL